jgi:hypothetical protein
MVDLWNLIWGKPQVDPRDLADAIERESRRHDLDFRTRVLIRDSTAALERYHGKEGFARWLASSPARDAIESIRREPLGPVGFPLLQEAIMPKTDPETVRQLLRELGLGVQRSVNLAIGGAVALILAGYLQRSSQDIDVVDEVPEDLRKQQVLLDDLAKRYQLQLTHFQSHDLPAGWEGRLHTLEPFGKLRVALVDVYDVFLGKLFSARSKDLDDLRVLLPSLDRQTIEWRLHESCGGLLAEASLKQQAERNWFILVGQPLP